MRSRCCENDTRPSLARSAPYRLEERKFGGFRKIARLVADKLASPFRLILPRSRLLRSNRADGRPVDNRPNLRALLRKETQSARRRAKRGGFRFRFRKLADFAAVALYTLFKLAGLGFKTKRTTASETKRRAQSPLKSVSVAPTLLRRFRARDEARRQFREERPGRRRKGAFAGRRRTCR